VRIGGALYGELCKVWGGVGTGGVGTGGEEEVGDG